MDKGAQELAEVTLPALIGEGEWSSGMPFEEFAAGAPAASARRMGRNYEQTAVPKDVRERYHRFAESGGRVYVLAEDWCGDCMAMVPVLARIAREGGTPLRIFRRDRWPELGNRHLTGGKAKIPLAVAAQVRPDETWHEVGRFVERPAQTNALMAGLSPDEARRVLQESYASGSYRPAAVAEFDAMAGGGVEEVAVPGSKGTPLRVYLHLPCGVRPAGAVIASHGANHDASHPLSLHLCQRLAQRGMAGVRFDFGYRVRGEPFSRDLAAELQDLKAVVGWVRSRLDLANEAVFLAGKSLGAVVSVMAATERALAGVVAFGCPLHLPGQPPAVPAERFAALKAPLLWFAGSRDAMADPVVVERYAARITAPLTLQWLEGADHSLQSHLHPALDTAVEWIRSRAG